jgi:hypothetical protein
LIHSWSLVNLMMLMAGVPDLEVEEI